MDDIVAWFWWLIVNGFTNNGYLTLPGLGLLFSLLDHWVVFSLYTAHLFEILLYFKDSLAALWLIVRVYVYLRYALFTTHTNMY